jgi:hypothetical protein
MNIRMLKNHLPELRTRSKIGLYLTMQILSRQGPILGPEPRISLYS